MMPFLTTILLVGLYEDDPHVVRLSAATFADAIGGREGGKAYAIEFFAPWCGHCQAFAPVWSKMAAAACAAAPVLQLATVDCVADAKLCRQQQIQSFPTIKLFVAGHTPPLGQYLAKCMRGCTSQRDMLSSILGAVPQTVTNAHGEHTAELQGLLRQGVSAIINHSAACAIQLPRGPTPALSPASSSAWQKQQLEELGYSSTLRRGAAPLELSSRPLPIDDPMLAALYGFQHELYATPAMLGTARKLAIEQWLQLLATALPGDSRRHELARLSLHAQNVTRAEDWQALLQPPLTMAMLPHASWRAWLGRGTPRWLACRGWSVESRGFPCGLWNLFHTLLAHSNDSARALLVIQGYVEHFFGCSKCAAHFRGLVTSRNDPPPDGVHAPAASAASAALWLWRAHNAVNSRLNRSTEDAVLTLGLHKVQWPDHGACPTCRDTTGHWRKGAVLRHLRATYCREQLASCAHMAFHGSNVAGGGGDGSDSAERGVDEAGLRAMAKAEIVGGEEGGSGAWWTLTYALLLAGLLAMASSRTPCSRRARQRVASPRLQELAEADVVCAYHQLRSTRD